MNILRVLILGVCGVLAAQVMAAEKKAACVTPLKEASSYAYAMIVTVMRGEELNQVVGGEAKFQPYLTYVVMAWPDNQLYILTLSPRSMGVLPLFDSVVTDQYGQKWQIKSDHWLCY